jgi:hypothetical protein
MTEDTSRPPDPATPPGEGGDTEPQSAQSREWLAQLQHMIDRIAAEAAPVARDVAAKAAELAAVAGEKAGPLAKRAAEVTEDVGSKMAVRSRRLADDLRHRGAESGVPPAAPADEGPAEAPVAPEELPVAPDVAPGEPPAG